MPDERINEVVMTFDGDRLDPDGTPEVRRCRRVVWKAFAAMPPVCRSCCYGTSARGVKSKAWRFGKTRGVRGVRPGRVHP